jgi:hypothetical protein
MVRVPVKRKGRLSGAVKVNQWAKGACFKEFRGRAPLIETCVEAVKETTDLVATGKALYFSDAVDQVTKGCMKRPLNDQMACLTGATEVLLRSKGVTANLEGKKKRRR